MAKLSPQRLPILVARAFEELDRTRSVFDLPARKFFPGHPGLDTTVDLHGRSVPSPLGPSAGPHTQMAQNLVLSWLGGARVMELKTVQVLDDLRIPRPCIDARTVGFNVEWSQELAIEQSLEEYVKGSMLIEMLSASGALPMQPGFDRCLFDVSIGYDLDGIRSERVVAFLRGMIDASAVVEALRRQIPGRWRHLRDVDFTRRIAGTATLSTFHGCPPAEIGGIVEFLMAELGLDCSVKLNPTLLGEREVGAILHDRLGFRDLAVPPSAFEKDPTWEQAVDIVGRLHRRAAELGRSFGVKLTNTLVVKNKGGFLPSSEEVAYLSGPPLHVLAMHLVRRFRKTFGDAIPISFSAGIDHRNYPDAVSLGLTPVTVCTDLLKQGGYGRLQGYSNELARRMNEVDATSVGEFIIRARRLGTEALDRAGLKPLSPGPGAHPKAGSSEQFVSPDDYSRWISEAKILNTDDYVDSLDRDPRYRSERMVPAPGKTGDRLSLFDCSTCDLCIPACPNDAITPFPSLEGQIPRAHLLRTDGAWQRIEDGATHLTRLHQIVTFVDFCNDCGNCEVFCPDAGAPNQLKLRLFGSEESWRSSAPFDGFFLQQLNKLATAFRVLARIDGVEYALDLAGAQTVFSGPSFRISIEDRDEGVPQYQGYGPAEIDLWPCALMDFVRRAIFDPSHVNYINCISREELESS